MKETVTILIISMIFFVIIIASTLSFLITNAHSHEWYDKECCSEQDCAPVLSLSKNSDGSMNLTSKHGTVNIPKEFSKRPSRDNQEHICMRPSEYGDMYPICYYVPMGS